MADLALVKIVAEERMKEFGLIDQGWVFKWDRGQVRFGCCHHASSKRPVPYISLSKYLCSLNKMEEVVDTILHEIAHALCGRGEGHGRRWRAMAVKVGCRPERCYSDSKVVKPIPKYVAQCPKCHQIVHAYRKRKRESACRRCCHRYNGGVFDPRFVFVYKELNIAPFIAEARSFFTIWGDKSKKPLLSKKTGEPMRFSSMEEAQKALSIVTKSGISAHIREGMGTTDTWASQEFQKQESAPEASQNGQVE